jgi:hypothetical protein
LVVGDAKASVGNHGDIGVELRVDGRMGSTTSSQTNLTLNRQTSDGQLISLQQDGDEQGSISVSGTTVAYGTFTGMHWADWAENERPPTEQEGMLVSTTDELWLPRKETLPAIRLSDGVKDPCVYGVVAGRERQDKGGTRLIIHALGVSRVFCTGPVNNGDYLCASEIPGVAMKQDDDILHNYTVAKVTRSDLTAGTRLVNVTLHCG